MWWAYSDLVPHEVPLSLWKILHGHGLEIVRKISTSKTVGSSCLLFLALMAAIRAAWLPSPPRKR